MDIKVNINNLITAVEYVQQHCPNEVINIYSLEYNKGLVFEFTDKNNKACQVTLFAGPITPEVKTIQRIYRNK